MQWLYKPVITIRFRKRIGKTENHKLLSAQGMSAKMVVKEIEPMPAPTRDIRNRDRGNP